MSEPTQARPALAKRRVAPGKRAPGPCGRKAAIRAAAAPRKTGSAANGLRLRYRLWSVTKPSPWLRNGWRKINASLCATPKNQRSCRACWSASNAATGCIGLRPEPRGVKSNITGAWVRIVTGICAVRSAPAVPSGRIIWTHWCGRLCRYGKLSRLGCDHLSHAGTSRDRLFLSKK